MNEFTSTLLPITLALMEAIKTTKLIPTRFLPVVSIVIGIILVFITRATGTEFSSVIIIDGMIIGLGASGLFDLGKKTILNK